MKRILLLMALSLPFASSVLFGNELVMKIFGVVEDKKKNTEFLIIDAHGKCIHQLHFDRLDIETQFESAPRFNGSLEISEAKRPISQTIRHKWLNKSFATKDIAFNQSENGNAWGFEYEVDFDYPIENGKEKMKIKAVSVVIGQDARGQPVAEYYFWPKRLSKN